MEETVEVEEVFVPETPMRVEVGMYYYVVCEQCRTTSYNTEESADRARALARGALWAKVKGRVLCGDCRGLGK